ncbi:MAG: histidine phosphotransferase family protein [Bdellovibrionales bacterium]
MQIDIRVLELLSSKLCHDLISPVSAVNNGVELIEDIGGDVVEEAMGLIGSSAAHAARRLRIFRMAYGRAGSEAALPLRDIRQVAVQYFVGGKTKLEWPEDMAMEGVAEKQGAFKVLLNVLLLAEEILAYGGLITLRRLESNDSIGCVIQVKGRQAVLSKSFQEALAGETEVEDLTPRTIQSYITGRFADYFGINLSFSTAEEDCLDISLQAPALHTMHHVA